MKIIRENNMKFLPNIIPAAITHHHGFLLLLVAIFTTVILRFSLTPAVFHQNLILTQTKYYMNMDMLFKNFTCLSTIKQLQYRLIRTRFKCVSLEKISTEENCKKWMENSQQLYTELATKKRLQNCENYFTNFPTAAHRPATSYEKQTPLAFSIMVHTQIGLFEAQLASIFKPHNSYCIFVDAKADKEFHKMVSNIIKCYKSKYPQATIFKVQKSHSVFWAHKSMLMGDLKCLNLLLEVDSNSIHQWQYYINQPATSLPIVRVEDIAKQLNQLKGPCDTIISENYNESCPLDSVYSIKNSSFDLRYQYKFVLGKADNPFEFYSDIARKTSKKLPPPPYNLTIFKGHKDVALTRSSAEFFMTSKLGKGFLKWLNSGVGFPEEFFFATLSRVSQHLYNTKGLISQNMDTDFRYNGTNDQCYRFSIWHPGKTGRNSLCKGKEIRYMCHFGLRDLPFVFFDESCAFANKFDLNVPTGPEAIACVHSYHSQVSTGG